MDKNIQCIILHNGSVLISEIEEAFGDIPGEPDCRLISPFKLIKTKDIYILEPWLDFSNQSVTMMRSGDAITFVEPNGELLDKYIKLTS
tara:strand:+ start:1443 stop:1709 length:267 start_codon:yes stop_codon:yes gene_type:complete